MTECNQDFADDLNLFYTRFDCNDFHDQNECLSKSLLSKITSNVGIVISELDVRNILRRVKVNKATGPDDISNRILKTCYQQLAPIFTRLYQLTLDLGVIPQIWKTSSIIPVPKGNRKGRSTDLNAFCPVALTSNVMKCLERLILKHLLSQAGSFIDPFQFAYRQNRGVEDAVLVLLYGIYSHLDIPKSYVRCTFIDLSSAFNTITPHLLINKLIEMEVDVKIVLWVHNFLTNRQQSVRLGNIKSPTLLTNTGAPQGCVLSPVIFTVYQWLR